MFSSVEKFFSEDFFLPLLVFSSVEKFFPEDFFLPLLVMCFPQLRSSGSQEISYNKNFMASRHKDWAFHITLFVLSTQLIKTEEMSFCPSILSCSAVMQA